MSASPATGATRRRAARTAVASAVLVVAACAHSTPTAAAASAGPPTGPPSSSTAVPSNAVQPAAQQSPPRCASAHLRVTLGPATGAAGSTDRALVFTNTGTAACTLRGFPGVSYVAGDDGHQVGPAARTSGAGGAAVVVAPGAGASADLQLVQVRDFDAAACRPTPVRGLRVYPPDDTASLFVSADGTGCAGTPPGPQLTVRSITGSR